MCAGPGVRCNGEGRRKERAEERLLNAGDQLRIAEVTVQRLSGPHLAPAHLACVYRGRCTGSGQFSLPHHGAGARVDFTVCEFLLDFYDAAQRVAKQEDADV
ncbi:hypothetical protein BaRGS_00030540 [Batillaria attramentaria]|uniref:Uncharacterized protein n=1 Tax=Batillaria attramentaria TaxID=370345 RepID=A0ABD0JU26_9CAEN